MKRHRWLARASWALLVAPGLAASSLATPGLSAQEPAPVFDQLRGDWCGEGTLMGRTARFAMGWRLHAGFAVLTFANGFTDTAGEITPALDAAALYRTSPERPEAVWLDSRDVRIEIRWEASDSALVAHWTAPTESGRTTYRIRSAEAVEVVDEVMRGSEWAMFGTARYRRAGPDADRGMEGCHAGAAPAATPGGTDGVGPSGTSTG